VRQRAIGEVSVGAIGIGGVNWSYPNLADEKTSIRTIHAAIDAGVTLIDTAHAYTTRDHESHNEWLISRALRQHSRASDVFVATKGGHYRSGETFPVDGKPETIRHHCEISLRNLGVSCIGLYQLHWPDPDVPVAESMGIFGELQREGKIRLIGVSNFSIAQIEEAQTVVSVDSVQNRFSPAARDDRPVIDYCTAHGIAYLPWFPLGGLAQAQTIDDDWRTFRRVAAERGVSTHQIVLAWHLAQAPVVIPIPGARRAESIIDSAKAADIDLTADEIEALDAPPPAPTA
jgi:aryl-alcohol dehydrogenase-like predicted oxidoreductase